MPSRRAFYRCDQCAAIFTSRAALLKHSAIHEVAQKDGVMSTKTHYDIRHETSGWVRGPFRHYIDALDHAGALVKEKGGGFVTIRKTTVTTETVDEGQIDINGFVEPLGSWPPSN